MMSWGHAVDISPSRQCNMTRTGLDWPNSIQHFAHAFPSTVYAKILVVQIYYFLF